MRFVPLLIVHVLVPAASAGAAIKVRHGDTPFDRLPAFATRSLR